jgi:hypothetical protein
VIGKTLAAAALLFAAQVHAETTEANPRSGPAADSPASMQSTQAGSLETKHQRKAVREQSRSVRGKSHQTARPNTRCLVVDDANDCIFSNYCCYERRR